MKEIRMLSIARVPYDENAFYNILALDRQRYKIVIDEKEPEYIVVCISHITYVNDLYKKFQEYYSNERVIIFIGDEAISPDMNLYDYAITYDDALFMGDRICRMPTSLRFRRWWNMLSAVNLPDFIITDEEYDRRKFCNFLYSNSKANANRDLLFYVLNKYQKVDASGKHLHNIETGGE